jgi:hypothetical protein
VHLTKMNYVVPKDNPEAEFTSAKGS